MNEILNILFGLVTLLIGYVIGRVWQKAIDRVQFRKARTLWGPLLSGHIQFVVSRFSSDDFTEPTGIVGGGDALALRELSAYFANLGAKNVSAVYVNEASMDRQNNLILIGGPETNEVTFDALALIRPNIRIVDPGPGKAIEVHDLAPANLQEGNHKAIGNAVIYKASSKSEEYGIIVRARNPFNPGRGLLIVSGAYGHGTWGGVRLLLESDFLHLCRQLATETRSKDRATTKLSSLMSNVRENRIGFSWPEFECIFKVHVFDGRPYAPSVIVFRQLGSNSEDVSS